MFEHVRDITDPEHPYSLEQLNVIEEGAIEVDDARGRVRLVLLLLFCLCVSGLAPPLLSPPLA